MSIRDIGPYANVGEAVRDLDLTVSALVVIQQGHDEFVEALCQLVPDELLKDDSDEGYDPEAVILDYFRALLGPDTGEERRRILPLLTGQTRVSLAGRMSWNVSAIYETGGKW